VQDPKIIGNKIFPWKDEKNGNVVAVVCNSQGYFGNATDENVMANAIYMEVDDSAMARVSDRAALAGGKEVTKIQTQEEVDRVRPIAFSHLVCAPPAATCARAQRLTLTHSLHINQVMFESATACFWAVVWQPRGKVTPRILFAGHVEGKPMFTGTGIGSFSDAPGGPSLDAEESWF
jgi:hypothetical protein